MLAFTFAFATLARCHTRGQSASGPPCSAANVECRVGQGLLPDSILNLTEVVWVGPESEHVYVGSPSIWSLPGTGELVASHDFFFETLNATVQVFIDHTGQGDQNSGASWEYAGNVSGMYWASLFTPPLLGRSFIDTVPLYLLGVSAGDHASERSIVISRSDDKGSTWSTPSVLMPAVQASKSLKSIESYHCAPTPVLTGSDGRLYRAFEVNAREDAFILSTSQPYSSDLDLLDPSSWQATVPLSFNQTTMIPSKWLGDFGWQEGNAVERFTTSEDGNLIRSLGVHNILRLDGQTTSVFNKAVVLKPGRESGKGSTITNALANNGSLIFDQIIDFPSTSSKFSIRYDPTSSAYYTLSTDVTSDAVSNNVIYARNHLVLAKSNDMYNWTICDTILADDTGFEIIDSARFTGFHYVDWIFDTKNKTTDLLAAIRTGYRGSNSYHNANRLTIKLCMQPEGFRVVGKGWCRPATKYVTAGKFLSKMECAQACLENPACKGFANGFKLGCALYEETPTASSEDQFSFMCYAKMNTLT